MLFRIISCCATFALLPTLFSACSPAHADDAKAEELDEPPPLVRAVRVDLQPVRLEIRTTGFLESEHQDTVKAQVAGRLLHLHVDEGSRVDKGQVLAKIDDRETQSALQQLIVQKERLEVDQSLAALEVEAAARRTVQARIEQQKAKAEFDRQANIDPEFVSPAAREDAELVWQSALEAVKVSEFNERKAALDVTRFEKSIADYDARIDELRVRLEHFEVVAPFAGVVTARSISPGAMVTAGAPLFDMVDPDHLIAWLDRPQSELDLARQSKDVTFTCDALPDRTFTADVDLVSPVIDRATGHFRLRVRVRPDDALTLVHGMFVRAVIRAEAERMALMVPKSAVLSEGDVAVVMAVRGGKALRTDLDPGLEKDNLVECRNRGNNGLEPGDLIIVEGHQDLEDQAAVRVEQ
jgi:HlyD family secretion protein